MTNKYEKESKRAIKKNRKSRRRFLTCDRKRKFETEEEAHNFNKVEAKVYKCPYCNSYHRSEQLNTLINIVRKKRLKKKK